MSTLAEIAEAATIAGVVPGGALALALVEVWAEETGRTVDPATGEITEPATDVATEQAEPGALPEAVLDSFRQYA